MNRYLEAYKARQCTVDDVLAAIRDRDFVATSGGVNAPLLFYKNIHKIAPRLKQGIDFFYGTTYKKGDFEFLESQACKGKIRTLSGFVLCKDERGYIQEGRVDYVPTHYHSQGMKMIQARGGLDVYVAAVCPMDERTGYFRTSLSNVNETDFRNSAKKIFLEVVPSLPVIYGNNEIHVSEADGIKSMTTHLKPWIRFLSGKWKNRLAVTWPNWWRTVPPSSLESAQSRMR